MKLLVVDDHDEIRLGLRQMLELTTSFEVEDAANGLEAVRTVDEVHPDVVIMAGKMPVMDGPEATRRIKRRFPEVRVIAFSTTGELWRVAPMLDAGASGCLLKGAPVEAVVDTVRHSIDLREAAGA
jgi:DNA-binding NarL/FixJ family response regulator